MFDLDGNGVFDKNEFRIALKFFNVQISAEQTEKLFREADIDRSGTMEFDEFLTLMDRISQKNTLKKRKFSTNEKKRIKEVFELFDIDGSGAIDAGELRITLNFLGIPMTEL